AVQRAQPRLVIEKFQVRRATRLKEVDDALRLTREMRHSCQPGNRDRAVSQQMRDRRSADDAGASPEKTATIEACGFHASHGIMKSADFQEIGEPGALATGGAMMHD